MENINSVVLVGRLCRGVEIRYTNGGMCCANFSIAVNSSKKENDQWLEVANFFDCVGYGKLFESLASYLTKGKKIAITGKLNQQRWKKDEQQYSKVVIVVQNIELLENKESNKSSGNNFIPAELPQASEETFDSFTDDIPF